MTSIYGSTPDELREGVVALGEPAYRSKQLLHCVYRRRAAGFEACRILPAALRTKLAALYDFGGIEPAGKTAARDGTTKILFRLADGHHVETVVIPAARRRTVCVSTQVGCKFKCAFCASGMRGFQRNLEAGEIVAQVVKSGGEADAAATHIVFMGMGEPLDNFDNLAKAIEILNDPEALGIAARRMTVSTSGYVPEIRRLAALGLQVNLSISLHAATEALRARLMPINRRFPLEALLSAAEDYLGEGGRKITLEFVLLKGVNDAAGDAAGLIRIAGRLRAKVNLIAYSPVAGLPFARPSEAEVRAFAARLEAKGVPVTIRDSRGAEIQAACGQLAGAACEKRVA